MLRNKSIIEQLFHFFCFCIIVILFVGNLYGQQEKQENQGKQEKKMTIELCYEFASNVHPVAKQKQLMLKSKQYTLDNIVKSYLPQITLSGQATYQSDVTKFNLGSTSNPTLAALAANMPTPNKDQYRVVGEVQQSLLDWITISNQYNYQEANYEVEVQKTQVDMFKVKERVTQVYFGILLAEEQIKQTELLKKDIEVGIKRMKVSVKGGVAIKSNIQLLEAELFKTIQRSIELQASRRAYIDMLAEFTNQYLPDETKFEWPSKKTVDEGIGAVVRPELLQFELEKKKLDARDNIIMTAIAPKLSVFFQGGYGNPGLNSLSNEFSFFWITGVRLNFPFSAFYSLQEDHDLIQTQKMIVENQKQLFLFNTNQNLKQQHVEIKKLEELIKVDYDIIGLRTSIKNATNVQLENGIITSNDYIREVNSEDQARQLLLLHQIQLLMAQYMYQILIGI